MVVQKSRKVQCTLKPVNLHDEAEFNELRRQRILCGWHSEPKHIENWREMMAEGLKTIFWIQIPDPPNSHHQPAAQQIQVGHISLDSTLDSSEKELASPDRSIMTVATFFIDPAYRSLGVGNAAMDIIEYYATRKPYGSPSCKAIALNTISRRYHEDDGEEWRGVWPKLGVEAPPRGQSNEDWYVRRGYVKFKEVPKYPVRFLDGTEWKLVAVYMTKTLQ